MPSGRGAAGDTPMLAVRGATKRFGAVLALDHVDLEVRAGEVVALLGDNGAGKSTLIKCLSGVHRLDDGVIELDGKPVDMRSPADARTHGIETVYQDLALFDNLGPGRELLRRARAGRPSLAATRPALPAHPGDERGHARGVGAAAGRAA